MTVTVNPWHIFFFFKLNERIFALEGEKHPSGIVFLTLSFYEQMKFMTNFQRRKNIEILKNNI